MNASANIDLRVEALRKAAKALGGGGGPLFAFHRDAVTELISKILDDSKAKPVNVRLGALAEAEQAWHFLATASAQRTGPYAPELAFADRCAREGYVEMLRAARRLGVNAKEEDPLPAPLVLLEPAVSPATYPRGADARVPTFTREHRLPLPFPLVFVPATVLGCVWMLTTVQHEVGHDIDEWLGLAGELRPVLRGESRLPAARREIWVGWTREIVADLLAHAFAGTGFYLTLHEWLSAIGLDGFSVSGAHPVPRARLALGLEALTVLGHSSSSTSKLPKLDGSEEWTRDVPTVTRLLLEAPLQALQGACLKDLAPDPSATEPELHGLIAALNATGRGWSLLPSAAQLAVSSKPADASKIHASAMELNPPQEDELIMPPRQARFYERVVPQLLAPILADERIGKKVPPAELFAAHSAFAFVGATNGQLADVLGAWKSKNGAAKKDRVEVFFLRDDLLEGLATAERSVAELRQEAAQGRRRLSALLTEVATRWAVYEFHEPYFFASYWDCDRPGGRIHVSSMIWGLEVREAPAVDYEWPREASAPGLQYERYRRGLENLRARSLKLAGSEESP